MPAIGILCRGRPPYRRSGNPVGANQCASSQFAPTPLSTTSGTRNCAAINAPMQGTAADIIKRAMIEVDAWLATQRSADGSGPAQMILQVHDELVFEVDAGFVDTLLAEVGTRMVGAAQLRVPLVVDRGVGANWDEAH